MSRLCPCALKLVSSYYACAVKFWSQMRFYKINNTYQNAVITSPVLSSNWPVVLFVYLLLLISILFIVSYTLAFLWIVILICILCLATVVLSWNVNSVVNLPYSFKILHCVATCVHAPVRLHGVVLGQRGNFYFIVMHITKSDMNDKHNQACRKYERSARTHARTQTRARIYTSVQQSSERNLQSLLLCCHRVLVRQACYFIVVVSAVLILLSFEFIA